MKQENMSNQLNTQAHERLVDDGIKALSLPLIAPTTGFRLRNIIIRKPKTFTVRIYLSQSI